MDIEFIVQDTFAACRPQWKIAPDLDEAGRLFADAVSQNYKNGDVEKAVEVEEAEEDSLSDDGDADELPLPPAEEQAESSDDTENEVRAPIRSPISSSVLTNRSITTTRNTTQISKKTLW